MVLGVQVRDGEGGVRLGHGQAHVVHQPGLRQLRRVHELHLRAGGDGLVRAGHEEAALVHQPCGLGDLEHVFTCPRCDGLDDGLGHSVGERGQLEHGLHLLRQVLGGGPCGGGRSGVGGGWYHRHIRLGLDASFGSQGPEACELVGRCGHHFS